eukprot:Colp12_sorted_trinity150504_noHs@4506
MRSAILFVLVGLLAFALAHPTHSEHKEMFEAKQNITCTVCTKVVDFYRKEMKLGVNISQDIINVANDICEIIPDPTHTVPAVCKIITNNIQDIIKAIADQATTVDICSGLQLCNA